MRNNIKIIESLKKRKKIDEKPIVEEIIDRNVLELEENGHFYPRHPKSPSKKKKSQIEKIQNSSLSKCQKQKTDRILKAA